MAKKAKPKAVNKPRSFADAVRGVKTPSVFAKTTCALKIPPTYPSRRIPTTKEDNSFFLDLRATNASDSEVAEALTKLENICGVNYREDLRTLEVIFSSDAARNSYRGKEITVEGKTSLYPILPRKQQPTIVYVRLANLPYGDEAAIKEAISGHWNQYGNTIDIAPHKVYGKWLTRRWDLLLELKEGKKLEAPVAFELLGRPLVAAWPSSLPSCLVCNSAGHQAKKCPQKNPKAGGCSDPEKKDLQKKTEKGKMAEIALEGSAETTEQPKSASVLETVSATVSKMASVSVRDLQADLQETTPAQEDTGAETKNDVMEVERPTTPPAQLINTVQEQETPTKGRKRMSKGDDTRRFPPPEWFPKDVKQYIENNNLCGHCLILHDGKKCTSPEEWDRSSPKLEEFYRVLRLKYGKPAPKTLGRTRQQTRAASSTKPMQEKESVIEVPAWCAKCQKVGHLKENCRIPDCSRCGSKDHINKFCSVGGIYGPEQ